MQGFSQRKLLGYENGRFLNAIIHWNKASKKDITKLKTKLFFGVSIFFVAVFLLTPSTLADWMDIPWDKRLHFKAGLCLSGMIYMISRSERNSREKSFVQSFSIGTLAGILYELVWDDLIKGVGADWEDSLYVTFGSATGSAICASLDYILFKEFNFTMSIPF